MKTLAATLLSALFTAVLAGCPIHGECGGEVDSSVNLTPEEFAKWQQGIVPADTGADPTTGAGAPPTGELLGEQELCEAVCEHHVGGTLLSCLVDEQALKVVVRCKVWYQCHESPYDS